MITLLIVIISFSILIIIHELGHFLTSKKFNLYVSEFGLGLPPRAWGKKIGETVYSINWLPFGGFVKIAGEDREDDIPQSISDKRIFYNLKIWQRAVIIAGGVVMNFFLGWLLFSAVLMMDIAPAVFIADVQPDSPAMRAGILANDKILGFSQVKDFIEFSQMNQGREVTINIERSGEDIEVKVKLRSKEEAEQGALGVSLFEGGHERMGFMGAIKEGFKQAVFVVGMTLQAVKSLITGAIGLKNVTGIVGIGKATSDAASLGLAYVLNLMGLISVNLAVFNILPFPALDGGRLLFLIIEKVKGSPLPHKFEQYANALGIILLIGIMILVTFQDIHRIFIAG